jgi:hypothetical protein
MKSYVFGKAGDGIPCGRRRRDGAGKILAATRRQRGRPAAPFALNAIVLRSRSS